jgi:hypothetical protein
LQSWPEDGTVGLAFHSRVLLLLICREYDPTPSPPALRARPTAASP